MSTRVCTVEQESEDDDVGNTVVWSVGVGDWKIGFGVGV